MKSKKYNFCGIKEIYHGIHKNPCQSTGVYMGNHFTGTKGKFVNQIAVKAASLLLVLEYATVLHVLLANHIEELLSTFFCNLQPGSKRTKEDDKNP